MKRVFFFSIIFAMSTFCAHTQNSDYRPFIEEGKVWISVTSDEIFPLATRYDFILGDTLVHGRKCKRWVQHIKSRLNGNEGVYTIAAYEIDKKVYYYHRGDTVEHLLFDFGLQKGDSISVELASPSIWEHYERYRESFKDTLYVVGCETKDINGTLRNIIDCWGRRPYFMNVPTMIEGVGSVCTPDWNISFVNHLCGCSYLAYCGIGDEILYLNFDVFDSYDIPLPTSITSPSNKSVNGRSAQGDASHLKNSVNSTFLDLSGRRLTTPPTRKGIYIKDGRKVLIK